MNFVLKPWQLALIVIAGWVNREQQQVIEYSKIAEATKVELIRRMQPSASRLLKERTSNSLAAPTARPIFARKFSLHE